MADPNIEMLPVGSLKPWKTNARTHSKKQVRQLADSIRTFGFTNPVLVDDAGSILAGHGRVDAARLIGMTEVPCVRLSNLTPEQKRAYVLADNKLALNAGWDEDLLALELDALMQIEDLEFDIGVIGFSIGEIDGLIEAASPEEDGDPEDDFQPDTVNIPARCKPGDLWQLGPHRLLCADSLDPSNLKTLMADQKARMVFTDPPYNVAIDGHGFRELSDL